MGQAAQGGWAVLLARAARRAGCAQHAVLLTGGSGGRAPCNRNTAGTLPYMPSACCGVHSQ
jgi:hypothetical protein